MKELWVSDARHKYIDVALREDSFQAAEHEVCDGQRLDLVHSQGIALVDKKNLHIIHCIHIFL